MSILYLAWRVSRTIAIDFVLDGLEQASNGSQSYRYRVVHHSDRGSQCLSIHKTGRLAEAGIKPSLGSRGDRHYNALVETIDGLSRAELIHRRGAWKMR